MFQHNYYPIHRAANHYGPSRKLVIIKWSWRVFYANISLNNVAGTAYAVPATFSVKYLHRTHISFILLGPIYDLDRNDWRICIHATICHYIISHTWYKYVSKYEAVCKQMPAYILHHVHPWQFLIACLRP